MNGAVLNDETEVGEMTATAKFASLLSGAALALGLVLGAAPAAHAGSDHGDGAGNRVSAESRADVDTTDWPQGKSLSDPDGDSNGGWDKPGFDGGSGDDQDGNNGCGNDIDREDDNNGNCGPEEAESEVSGNADDAVEPCGDDSGCPEADGSVSAAGTMTETGTQFTAGADTAGPGTSVAGATEVAPADTGTITPGTQVLEISESAPDTLARGGALGALALTGIALGALALTGGLSLGGGRLARLIHRPLGS